MKNWANNILDWFTTFIGVNEHTESEPVPEPEPKPDNNSKWCPTSATISYYRVKHLPEDDLYLVYDHENRLYTSCTPEEFKGRYNVFPPDGFDSFVMGRVDTYFIIGNFSVRSDEDVQEQAKWKFRVTTEK